MTARKTAIGITNVILLTADKPSKGKTTSVGQSPDLSRDHQRRLQEFLKQADLVKFAGVKPGEEDIRRSIDTAGRFLDETRQDAPLIEVPADETAPHTAVSPPPEAQEVPHA